MEEERMRREDMWSSQEHNLEYVVDIIKEEEEQREEESMWNNELLETEEDSIESQALEIDDEVHQKENLSLEEKNLVSQENVHDKDNKNAVHDQFIRSDTTNTEHDKETIFQRLRRQAKLLQEEKALHRQYHNESSVVCSDNNNFNRNKENYNNSKCKNNSEVESNWAQEHNVNNNKHDIHWLTNKTGSKMKTKLSWAEWSAFEARNREHIYNKEMIQLVAQSSLPEHVTFHPHILAKSAKLDEERNNMLRHNEVEHEIETSSLYNAEQQYYKHYHHHYQEEHDDNSIRNYDSNFKRSSEKCARWVKLYNNASEVAARRRQHVQRLEENSKAERTKSYVSPASVQWLANSEASSKFYKYNFINRQELYAQKSAKEKEALQQSLLSSNAKHNNRESTYYNNTHQMQSSIWEAGNNVKSNGYLLLSSESSSPPIHASRLETSKQRKGKIQNCKEELQVESEKMNRHDCAEGNFDVEHSYETCNLSSEASYLLSPIELPEKSRACQPYVHSSTHYKKVTEFNAQMMYEREMNAAVAKAERMQVQQKRKVLSELLECTFRPCINENVVCKGASKKCESALESGQIAGVDEFLWRQSRAQQMKKDLEERKRTISEGKVCKYFSSTLTQPFTLSSKKCANVKTHSSCAVEQRTELY